MSDQKGNFPRKSHSKKKNPSSVVKTTSISHKKTPEKDKKNETEQLSETHSDTQLDRLNKLRQELAEKENLIKNIKDKLSQNYIDNDNDHNINNNNNNIDLGFKIEIPLIPIPISPQIVHHIPQQQSKPVIASPRVDEAPPLKSPDQTHQRMPSLSRKISQLTNIAKTSSKNSTRKNPSPHDPEKDNDLRSLIKNSRFSVKDKEKMSNREQIINEIFSTEQYFLSGLNLLDWGYYKPLMKIASKEKRVDETQVKSIFENLESLLLICTRFYNDLEARINHWEEEGQDHIGDIFVKWGKFFKSPFSRYGDGYDMALRLLSEKAEGDWKEWIDELDSKVVSINRIKWDSYLIMPIQRIPKYLLLLRDLLKYTNENHIDYVEVNNALEIMQSVAFEVNEHIRRSQSATQLINIMNRKGHFYSITTHPTPPPPPRNRQWVKDGEIIDIIDINNPRKEMKKYKEIILFNDILVSSGWMATTKKIDYREYCLPLSLTMFSTNLTENEKHCIFENRNHTSFEHPLVARGPETTWIIELPNKAESIQWQNIITEMLALRSFEEAATGRRKGKYTFSRGTFEGEWCDGWMRSGIYTDNDETIINGFWWGEFNAGFGDIKTPDGDHFYSGWIDTPEGPKIHDPYEFWKHDDLTDHDWDLITTRSQTITKPAGERIIEQGKKNSNLFRSIKGQLRVEKSLQPGAPKTVLAVLPEGTVVGDTSVIATLDQASADVVTETEVQLQVMSIPVLYALFNNNPGLCMRFYRRMARKLSNQLKNLHDPNSKKQNEKRTASTESSQTSAIDSDSDEFSESEKSDRSEKISSGVLQSARSKNIQTKSKEDSNIHEKFSIKKSETLIDQSDCILKGVLKKVGKLYVFSEHVCFDAKIFGKKDIVSMSLGEITGISLNKKKLQIQTGKTKYVFTGINDVNKLNGILVPLWQDATSKESSLISERGPSTKRTLEVIESDKDVMSTGIQMTSNDWGLVLKGAQLKEFQKGEIIVKEGVEHQRIYQIGKGSVTITKKTSSGEITLGDMKAGSLFGEMTFLEGKPSEATASIIANENETTVYIIEGWFINICFIKSPELAGRFYSYLTEILAQRLADRESKINRQKEKESMRRIPE